MDEMPDYDPTAIEGTFVDTWDKMELYFKYHSVFSYPGVQAISRLISEMREKGYDRTLRAGQGMLDFCVSRSLKHGLRLDQARIVFRVYPTDTDLYVGFYTSSDQIQFTQNVEEVVMTTKIEALVKRLLAEPIN